MISKCEFQLARSKLEFEKKKKCRIGNFKDQQNPELMEKFFWPSVQYVKNDLK